MSVTIYPWSKPGKESPAGPEYDDCCGLRPILLRWPRQIYIGVICQNPNCTNSHNGVLACDVDIVEKWEHYRVKTEEQTTESMGVKLIAQERQRQIEVEGWTTEHDSNHTNRELTRAAACYLVYDFAGIGLNYDWWPWSRSWWKPKDRLSNLVRAGALIAAEIDRLKRLEEEAKKPQEGAEVRE